MVSFEVHALVFIRIQVVGCIAFEDKGTVLCQKIRSHSPEDNFTPQKTRILNFTRFTVYFIS